MSDWDEDPLAGSLRFGMSASQFRWFLSRSGKNRSGQKGDHMCAIHAVRVSVTSARNL